MKNKSCLLCIDIQNDFLDGGSLAVPNGNEVIPIINKLLPQFDLVIFTKDYHDWEMDAFASTHEGAQPFDKYTNKQGEEDTLWPDHCIEGTFGAQIHKDIDFNLCKQNYYIFKKGLTPEYHPYSGFGKTGLDKFLRNIGIEKIFIGGLAFDYCVRDTAIDSSHLGFNTIVILDACRSIDSDLSETKLQLSEANVKIIESWELPLFNLL